MFKNSISQMHAGLRYNAAYLDFSLDWRDTFSRSVTVHLTWYILSARLLATNRILEDHSFGDRFPIPPLLSTASFRDLVSGGRLAWDTLECKLQLLFCLLLPLTVYICYSSLQDSSRYAWGLFLPSVAEGLEIGTVKENCSWQSSLMYLFFYMVPPLENF